MSDDTKNRVQPSTDTDPDVEILEVIGYGDEDNELDDSVDVPMEPDEPPADDAEAEAPRRDERPGSPFVAREGESTRDQLLRLHADFENLKKRIDKEREEYYRYATKDLVSRLLPVLDNLERAFVAGSHSPSEESVRAGVTLIHRQLLDELRKEGLEAVDAVGQPFDPGVHEAVATDTTSTVPSNTVVEELQKGYFLRGRLLRPALVRVSVSSPNEEGE